MRMASKSAMGFPRSNGLERYKMSSFPAWPLATGCRDSRPMRGRLRLPVILLFRCCLLREQWKQLPQFPLRSGLVGRDGSRRHLALVGLDQLHVKAQRLQFANQHVERFRHARLDRRFAFDDGLVNLGAAIDVIGLRGEQFLQDVGCAVGLQGPDFHLAEALPTELRLAAQRLLGNQRVWSDGTRMDLVINKMRELEHVNVAHGYRLLELLARHA